MRTSVQKILGPKVAERCKDVWDLDEEGELNAVCHISRNIREFLRCCSGYIDYQYILTWPNEQMWRPSGHPNFWYMGGNLALCRVYSKFLALQIKAAEEGLSSKSKALDSKL